MIRYFFYFSIISTKLLFPGFANSEEVPNSQALHEIAAILFQFEHRPSASGILTLRNIIKDETTNPNERILAKSILNIKKRIAHKDKPKLEAMIRNQNTPFAAREIAHILYTLTDRPTAADKQYLNLIMHQENRHFSRSQFKRK